MDAFFRLLICTLLSFGLLPALASAQEEAPAAERSSAQLVSVPLPIRDTVDMQVKQAIDRALARDGDPDARPLVVLEFTSRPNQDGSGSEFERCLSLARYLSGEALRQTRTVAFLPEDVTGHAVLVAMACEEIIMHPDASFGSAGLNESLIDRVMREAYRDMAERRRTIPVAVALGMLDKNLSVSKIGTLDGFTYADESEIESLKETTSVSSVESIVPAGSLGLFEGRELRLEFGFVSHLVRNRQELATVLGVSPDDFERDQVLGDAWQPVRIEVRGPVNADVASWIIRSAQQRLSTGSFNLLCVTIDSPGGSAVDSLRLADYLAGLDPATIRTVAFVPEEARADAALIAFACDQLAIAEDAVLGGPGARVIAERDRSGIHEAIRALALRKGRDWSLGAALVDPTLEVYRYREEIGNQTRYFSETEQSEQMAPASWIREERVELGEGLSGQQAKQLRLADHMAADFNQVKRIYGLQDDPETVRPNWAHRLIERLASRRLAAFLLFIGCFAVLTEVSQPGLGVAGFVAAVCFVIYFWSNFLHGTAGWLEVLLFFCGLAAIGIEILVLPGFGVFGFGGGLLLVASIVLASQTFVFPRNSYQMNQLPGSLAMVLAAMAGATAAAVMMRHYLADIPVLGRILLNPLEPDELEELDRREALGDYGYLLGKRGTTVTPLTPSGKVRFGDDVVSVITGGTRIEQGTDVCVADVQGNRVIVKQLDPS